MMRDFERWKSANQGSDFNLFDYAHAILHTAEQPFDLVLALATLVWPKFVEVNDFVFLAEQFDETKYQNLSNGRFNQVEVQFWMNLFSLDGFVGERATKQDIEELAQLMCQSWEGKLRQDYGHLSFSIRIVKDEDVGDVCLVFTQ